MLRTFQIILPIMFGKIIRLETDIGIIFHINDVDIDILLGLFLDNY